MSSNQITTALILTVIAVSVTSCAQKDKTKHGIILEDMDTAVSPKDDFYNFVNGNWMKNNQIPDDENQWGGFTILRKQVQQEMLDILNKAAKSGKYASETDQGKALSLYNSYIDTTARNKAGIEPLKPILEKIDAVKSMEDLQNLIAQNTSTVSQPFFGVAAFANLTNSSVNSAYITTGGLGLPDRDFYTNTDPASVKIREQYKEHIARMLQFLGDSEPSAKKQAEVILNFETKLAEPQLDKVASRDVRNFNNPRSLSQINNMLPQIKWEKALHDLGVEEIPETIIVMEPKYMDALRGIFSKPDLETWKTVIRWSTLNNAAGNLTTEIEKANWDFYSKTLNGTLQQKPLNERALTAVNGSIGEALGKLYVDEYFPPEAKQKAETMIANIIDAYKDRIRALDWMGEETKTKAIEKLDKFTVKIGYPDKWKDYSELSIDPAGSLYANSVAISDWAIKDNLAKIDQPVDRTEWGMNPQTVNAYFNPLYNEIVFPAAILQPPFYDYKADEAVNYGGIGAVIGHEISHAFDDSGARFDADGNLVNWWSDEDLSNFTARADKLADQYSAVEVIEGSFINGKFTLGENIGDLGGLLGAYDGLQRFFKENGRPESIDGFTPEQRFFISWATIWRTLSRDEALRNQVKVDPHSPGRVRATQPLLNIDAFYKAFDITEGDSMYLPPEKRVYIW